MSIDVRSEISGKVWKIEVEPGDMLDEDEPIFILESMKMEIPVPAPFACRVLDILVAEEDAVAEGQTVARIERT